MVNRKNIFHCSCEIYFIQCKQFSGTNVISHAFQQISDLKIFPECFCGPLKILWWAICGP